MVHLVVEGKSVKGRRDGEMRGRHSIKRIGLCKLNHNG